RRYVQGGRRWLALHGTNSILRFMEDDSIETPDWAAVFFATLGSILQAHPPIAPYRVEPTGVEHPLVEDIEAFEVEDEQYLVQVTAPIEVLLDTEFEGQAGRFRANPWKKDRHPVLYLRHLGEGAVCYLTLGHCRGHDDLLSEHGARRLGADGGLRAVAAWSLLGKGRVVNRGPGPRSLSIEKQQGCSVMQASGTVVGVSRWEQIKALSVASLGGMVEYFEFIIFVFLATHIANHFTSPDMPEWLRLMQAFGIFAAGFFIRPVGGIIMAQLGDLVGRKRIFTLTLALM